MASISSRAICTSTREFKASCSMALTLRVEPGSRGNALGR